MHKDCPSKPRILCSAARKVCDRLFDERKTWIFLTEKIRINDASNERKFSP